MFSEAGERAQAGRRKSLPRASCVVLRSCTSSSLFTEQHAASTEALHCKPMLCPNRISVAALRPTTNRSPQLGQLLSIVIPSAPRCASKQARQGDSCTPVHVCRISPLRQRSSSGQRLPRLLPHCRRSILAQRHTLLRSLELASYERLAPSNVTLFHTNAHTGISRLVLNPFRNGLQCLYSRSRPCGGLFALGQLSQLFAPTEPACIWFISRRASVVSCFWGADPRQWLRSR